MASEKIQTFTDGNFEQVVVKSEKPVLVDFWAEWCGPCRRLAPTVDELAKDYNGRVVVAKMNVDENTSTCAFSIRGIPTISFSGRRDRRVDRGPGRQGSSEATDDKTR